MKINHDKTFGVYMSFKVYISFNQNLDTTLDKGVQTTIFTVIETKYNTSVTYIFK